MARAQKNGRLEEALAALVQAQATLVQNMATLVQTQTAFVARMAESDARFAEWQRVSAALQEENRERFARIEAILLEHSRILADHTRILQALPDAIREKIGFKIPGQQ
jgi:hypothetical protein